MLLLSFVAPASSFAAEDPHRVRARDIGIEVGTMETGSLNAITDVPGVMVGQQTIIRGDNVRTGVTTILPHSGNLYQEKVPAAFFAANAHGKTAGSTQIVEMGNIETPIVLTNTLSVGTAMTALVKYTLELPGNEEIRSVNAVVGETNDGFLNDIRGLHVTEKDVLAAIKKAATGPVEEGNVGAGTGTRAFGLKGGIGTSSRLIPTGNGSHYTLGVLVQTNYGGLLEINGAPVGRELRRLENENAAGTEDGSCMIIVATDAPLSSRNLERILKRTVLGLARTGSHMSNGSGDYAIGFSTAYRIPYDIGKPIALPPLIPNESMTPYFQAVIEATQEAVYNSMFMATTLDGRKGRQLTAIPIEKVLEICRKYNVLNLREKLD